MLYTDKQVAAVAILVLIAGLSLGWLIGSPMNGPSVATIGDNDVPALHCEEDEFIGFSHSDPAPRPLSCVHIDDEAGR